MKAKIDRKLCILCDFSDKENTLNGIPLCLPKMEGGNCWFDK